MARVSATRTLENALRREGYCHVAGVDEVGRGAFAGPVVAELVVRPPAAGGHLMATLCDVGPTGEARRISDGAALLAPGDHAVPGTADIRPEEAMPIPPSLSPPPAPEPSATALPGIATAPKEPAHSVAG